MAVYTTKMTRGGKKIIKLNCFKGVSMETNDFVYDYFDNHIHTGDFIIYSNEGHVNDSCVDHIDTENSLVFLEGNKNNGIDSKEVVSLTAFENGIYHDMGY